MINPSHVPAGMTVFETDQEEQQFTNDVTLEDEYEMQRLDSLPEHLRTLAGLHAIDQFEAVPSYFSRFS